jgi:hypothetical protein
MKKFFNRMLLDQVNLDTASLTTAIDIIHKFDEPGEYNGEITRNERNVGQFRLVVSENYSNKQANIDLKALDLPSGHQSCCNDKKFTLAPGGFCIFNVSEGMGGYSVDVYQSSEHPNARPFHSSELMEGDMVTATIMRPGVYEAVNVKNKTKLEIVVPYPKRSDKNLVLKPVTVECTDKAIKPDKITLDPGNGLIFSILTSARITIGLKKPINRPDKFKEPNDVPRSIQRRVLAVMNSSLNPAFLAKKLDINEEKVKKFFFAKEKIKQQRNIKRFGDLSQLYEIAGEKEETFTKLVNSLLKTYTELTTLAKKKRS